MAKDKITKLELRISGIPQEWITPDVIKDIERRSSVFIELQGVTRSLVFTDQNISREFLKDYCGIG